MLAVVKTPHTVELSLHGASHEMDAILDAIRMQFPVQVVCCQTTGTEETESAPVEATDWWKKMQENRAGHLLAGARLKKQLTQAELARRSGVPQSHISAMEKGRQKISLAAAKKLGEALGEALSNRIFGENFARAKPRVCKATAKA
jgi:DNA-binding XRE family transcriptional regulator